MEDFIDLPDSSKKNLQGIESPTDEKLYPLRISRTYELSDIIKENISKGEVSSDPVDEDSPR
jgi:hypothetical protein